MGRAESKKSNSFYRRLISHLCLILRISTPFPAGSWCGVLTASRGLDEGLFIYFLLEPFPDYSQSG